jgi:hypothetical protein
MTRWEISHGRRIEIAELDLGPRHHTKRKPPKARFTKFPGLWEEVLGKARASGSTYSVAHVLIYEAWKLTSRGLNPTVKLTDTLLKRVYVGRRGKRQALHTLERLKLVGVERRDGRNPLVTVYFIT